MNSSGRITSSYAARILAVNMEANIRSRRDEAEMMDGLDLVIL